MNLVWGRIDQWNIRDLLGTHAGVVADLGAVLITAFESDRSPSLMPWASESPPSHREGPGLSAIANRRDLLELLDRSDPFNGFDELWIPRTTAVEVPNDLSRCSCELIIGIPPPIRRFWEAGAYRLGLGDGDGLNFVAKDLQLAEALGLGGRIAQPSLRAGSRPWGIIITGYESLGVVGSLPGSTRARKATQPAARTRPVLPSGLPQLEGSLFPHARYHSNDHRAPPPRDRYRLAGGTDRAPDGAHQPPD